MKEKIIFIIVVIVLIGLVIGGCILFGKIKYGSDYNALDDSVIGRAVGGVFGDSDIVYQANTRFLYSRDGGSSWSETIQEIPVGETYYLAIEIQISQSEQTKDEKEVVATISIPGTEILDCYLDDHPGTSITGSVDSINKTVRYDFSIIASTTPEKFRIVFECKPISAGRATVVVTYDDSVSSSWDMEGTIKYV